MQSFILYFDFLELGVCCIIYIDPLELAFNYLRFISINMVSVISTMQMELCCSSGFINILFSLCVCWRGEGRVVLGGPGEGLALIID